MSCFKDFTIMPANNMAVVNGQFRLMVTFSGLLFLKNGPLPGLTDCCYGHGSDQVVTSGTKK